MFGGSAGEAVQLHVAGGELDRVGGRLKDATRRDLVYGARHLLYGDIPEDPGRTMRLVCEEIGHSVGLDHSGDGASCMSASTARHLTDHDENTINGQY